MAAHVRLDSVAAFAVTEPPDQNAILHRQDDTIEFLPGKTAPPQDVAAAAILERAQGRRQLATIRCEKPQLSRRRTQQFDIDVDSEGTSRNSDRVHLIAGKSRDRGIAVDLKQGLAGRRSLHPHRRTEQRPSDDSPSASRERKSASPPRRCCRPEHQRAECSGVHPQAGQ
ncbi:MAG: hypothetical protein OXG83_00270 [Acidobacteria bacterium]|nr:hypothetical protein [Acidobacteriota bacterium]